MRSGKVGDAANAVNGNPAGAKHQAEMSLCPQGKLSFEP